MFLEGPLPVERVNALKTEYKSDSALECFLENEAVLIKNNLQNNFGQFLDPSFSKSAIGIEKRILVMNQEDFTRFDEEWGGRGKEKNDSGEILAGCYYPFGRLIALLDPVSFFQAQPEEVKQSIKDKFNTFGEKQKQVFTLSLYQRLLLNLAHEIVHAHEDSFNLNLFTECGARYYQYQIVNPSLFNAFFEQLDRGYITYYQGLIDIYGDDVHKLYFGSLDLSSSHGRAIGFLIQTGFVKPEGSSELFPENSSYLRDYRRTIL